MKTRLYSLISILFFYLFIGVYSLSAQEVKNDDNIIIINGIIKDKNTGKNLGYVNISDLNTNIGTITNADGEFSLKLNKRQNSIKLYASNLGYKSSLQEITIPNKNKETIIIYMQPDINLLNEIIIYPNDPRLLIERALEKINDNYSNTPLLLTCFYREIIEKRNNCINISEAITETYKTPYNKSNRGDKVRIKKGRKLISPKIKDTLMVKLLGGPSLIVNLDIVKDKEGILSIDELKKYNFHMENCENINNRTQYVIRFIPKIIPIDYPLFYGRLFIDKELLAFTRAEFSMSMDDPHKATKAILYKKPARLRFKPKEVSFIVTYNYVNGKTYLSYIRNNIKFKCDWKKRLFSTNYSLTSEMVVTDINNTNIEPFSNKEAFKDKDAFLEKVALFQDENFWQKYNIIEPTQSLENSVNKLIKKNK